MAGLDDFLRDANALYGTAPAAPTAASGPPGPTGRGGMVSSALFGGGREALSQVGSAVKAGATLFGANDLAKSAGDWAAQQQAAARAAENPAWENTSVFSPAGLGYRVLKGMPAAGAILGGALAAPVIAGAAPGTGAAALIGGVAAGALGYPLAVGQNVQTREAYTGKDVSQGEAGAAAALGVPMAAIGALPMERVLSSVAKPVTAAGWRGMLQEAGKQAGVQAVAGAGQDMVAQQMGDPNRGLASRAQELVESALTGGATGALFGAGIHALAKRAPASISNEDLKGAADQELKLLPPPTIEMGGPGRTLAGMGQDELIAHARAMHAQGDRGGLFDAVMEMKRRDRANIDQSQDGRLLPPPAPTDQLSQLALPAPRPEAPGAPEAPVATGEPIVSGGPVGPPEGAIPLGGYALPTRPFAEWTPEQIITEAKQVRETNPERFQQLAYEAMYRTRQEANETPRLPPPNVATPVGGGLLRWPDGTIAPPNPGRVSEHDAQTALRDANGVPAGWVRWPDGSYGPPNAISGHEYAGLQARADRMNRAERGPIPVADMRGDGVPQPHAEDMDLMQLAQHVEPPDQEVRSLAEAGEAPDEIGGGLAAPRNFRSTVTDALAEAGVKKAPKFVDDLKTPDDVRQAWEGRGPNKALRAIAGKLGMLDESGELKPAGEAPEPANAPPPPEAPAAPKVAPLPRDLVGEKHQGRYDALEAMRAKVPADHQEAITDAQTALVSPGRGDVQRAEATLRRLQTVADGARAAAELQTERSETAVAAAAPEAQPAEAPAAPEPSAQAQPLAEPTPKPAPSPSAVAKADAVIARLKAIPENPTEKPVDVEGVLAAGKKARDAAQSTLKVQKAGGVGAARTPDQLEGLRGLLDSTGVVTLSDLAKVLPGENRTTLDDVVGRLRFAGVLTPRDGGGFTVLKPLADAAKPAPAAAEAPAAPEAPQGPTDKYSGIRSALEVAQNSLNDLRMNVKASISPSKVHDSHINYLWQDGLAKQQERLDLVKRTLEQDPESLRGMPGDIFQTPLWDEHYDKLMPTAQDALRFHAGREEKVLQAIQKVFPTDDWFAAKRGSAAPSQMDADIEHIVKAGGTTKDLLEHLAQNGTDPATRLVSKWLLDRGVNPDVAFTDPARFARFENTWPPHEGGVAMYDTPTDTVHLFDRTDLERNVVHEAVHAGSARALDANDTPAARAFNDLFDATKARFPNAGHYGLTDAHEFLAEGLSNDKFRRWLKSQDVAGENKTLWQKFKDGVARLLGFSGSKQTLLDQVMERGKAVLDADTQYARELRTPEGQEAQVHPYFATLRDMADRAKEMPEEAVTNLWPKMRGALLGWTNSLGIAKWYGQHSPGMRDWIAHTEGRDLLNEANNKAGRASLEALEKLPAATVKKLQSLAVGTQIGLDARKGWGAHGDLFDKPNAAELMREHSRLQSMWGTLTPEERGAYNGAIAANRAHIQQLYATSLYTMLRRDYAKGVSLDGVADPSVAFRDNPTLHDDPVKNEQFWASTYSGLARLAQDHIGKIDGARVGLKALLKDSASDAEKTRAKARMQELTDSVSPLRSLLSDRATRVAEMDRLPNFPMGRQGAYFAAGKLVQGDDGLAPARNVVRLQKMLNAAGFGHLTIDRNLENPSVYARVDTPAQMDQLAKVFKSAHDAGLFEKGSLSNGAIHEIGTGVLPGWQERAMEIMRSNLEGVGAGSDPATSALIEQRIAEAKREFLDALPPSSLNKIMARREGVQGFSGDMIGNLRQRMSATSRALANIATMPNIADAVVQMRKDVDGMNRADVPSDRKLALHQAVQELTRSEAQRAMAQPGAPMQALREATHVMEVGASPAYVFTLMSQLGTLSLPRLGAEAGFLKSAQAMGRVTKQTFDVMRAVAGGSEGLRFGLRESDLLKAGISPRDVDFLTHQAAMGSFNHGSYTMAMRSEYGDPNSQLGKVRGWASAMGLYSEMMPRVLTALAARDLWNGNPQLQAKGSLHDFTHRMVEDSQLNWNPTFNARQVTKAGTFGAMSPLINQFMGYSTRVTEMLYREAATAMGRGNAAEQASAQKFLLGHLAAITTLSGTLGAPMAAVFASVYDRLADWVTNKDDHDITASYRNFLANTFGKDVGEVIARGVPRAFGLDLSHLGDQRIAPGSSALLYLTEKRKLEDAERDWLKAEAGSASGLVANYAFAARDIANGDYLNGLQKMVPDLFRGPVEATKLGLYGYRDRSGMKLPITAGARDILLTAVGMDPAQEAEYGEMRKTASGVANLSAVRAQNITQHMSLALTRGDMDNFKYWMGQSQEYMRDHPGMEPPVANLSRYMQQHYRGAAFAGATGGPIGVRPRDLNARGMVGYGNLPGR